MASGPELSDIEAAAARIRAHVRRTPLIEVAVLSQLTGGRVFIKAEPLQRTGSFKFRGAMNAALQLDEAARQRGIIAYSSGNHAQAVAAAARVVGSSATIVMPADAPEIKMRLTRAQGAEIVTYDRFNEDREAIGEALSAERGLSLIKPYDDARVIAGQGTCGLEIAEQAEELEIEPDAVLVCCGGGGLTAGVALAMTGRRPGTAIYSVEPEAFDDTRRSLISGKREQVPDGARSICDALLAPQPGVLTFQINQRLLAGGLAVSDEAARRAMAFAFENLKIVLEPGGAVALAAILEGAYDASGKTVVAVLSGGNVDSEQFITALDQGASDRAAA